VRILTDTERTILEKHAAWKHGETGGERANLRWVNLRGADLSGADLSGADLSGANLRGADLRGADLHGANLRGANLREADLRRANLREADLSGADLSGADLRRADLDFACWPLWCGTRGVVVDVRIACQLAAHLCAVVCDDPEFLAAREALLPFARQSHRAADLGLLPNEKE
jgi:hypothetical protein